MGIKVLFLYPNTYGMNMLPPAIATFSSILKNEGIKNSKVLRSMQIIPRHIFVDEAISSKAYDNTLLRKVFVLRCL